MSIILKPNFKSNLFPNMVKDTKKIKNIENVNKVKKYPKPPDYIIKEAEFLHVIFKILYEDIYMDEDDIIKYYEEETMNDYRFTFGDTPISTLLSYRNGINYDYYIDGWYTNNEKFCQYIRDFHRENEKLYGKNYDKM
jgi:hypothetical protein